MAKKSSKNPNRITFKCPNCGSNIVVDDGYYQCSQDALPAYAMVFVEWQAKGEEHAKKMYDFSHSTLKNMYDSWKVTDELGNRPMFFCDYEPMKQFNPMTQHKVWLPDPAQQRIAEEILERPLTEYEYNGLKKVPLLDEQGNFMVDSIRQLEFPREFITIKDMVDKTDYSKMPKLFNLKELRKRYEEFVDELDNKFGGSKQ
jgi:hypothetical protein